MPRCMAYCKCFFHDIGTYDVTDVWQAQNAAVIDWSFRGHMITCQPPGNLKFKEFKLGDAEFFKVIDSLILLDPKIYCFRDCGVEMGRRLVLGRTELTNLEHIWKDAGVTIATTKILVNVVVDHQTKGKIRQLRTVTQEEGATDAMDGQEKKQICP